MRVASWIALIVMAVACRQASDGTDGLYPYKDDPENLAGLLETIARAAETGDVKKAGALTRALIPDEAGYRKALAADAPSDLVKRLVGNLAALPREDAELARLIRRGDPSQTRVNVHGATREEIEAGSTPAAREFPGGARERSGLLRPGLRFYEAEFVAPGEDFGMKYHLFFWDGTRWRMLGPIWRALE